MCNWWCVFHSSSFHYNTLLQIWKVSRKSDFFFFSNQPTSFLKGCFNKVIIHVDNRVAGEPIFRHFPSIDNFFSIWFHNDNLLQDLEMSRILFENFSGIFPSQFYTGHKFLCWRNPIKLRIKSDSGYSSVCCWVRNWNGKGFGSLFHINNLLQIWRMSRIYFCGPGVFLSCFQLVGNYLFVTMIHSTPEELKNMKWSTLVDVSCDACDKIYQLTKGHLYMNN